MFRYTISSAIIFALITMVAFQQISALKCWNCMDVYDKFCNENWDLSEITEEVRVNHYLPCPGEKCFKSLITNDDGIQSVQRRCMKDTNAADAFCEASKRTALSYGHRNVKIACVTCDTDGCNGAALYGPIDVLIILPATLLIFLPQSL